MKHRLHFKRFLSFLLCIAVCEFSWAKFQVDGIYYELISNGAEVTYNNPNGGNYSGDVVIPSSVEYYNGFSYDVVSIGSSSFWQCPNLTSVKIPESVKIIDKSAFSGCTKLTSVVIPKNVTSIEFAAFADCTGLTNVSLPDGLINIGPSAFLRCISLKSVTIPKGVTNIEGGAFNGCSGLTSISVAADNIKYDSRNNCNAIIETESNILIKGCENTIIPNSVKTIRSVAFQSCSGLTSITIPDGVIKIGNGAFSYCINLTSVTIPNSVTTIDDYAFEDCSSLKEVICEKTYVPNINANVFQFVPLSTATLYVPSSSLDAYKNANQWKNFGTILPIEDYSAVNKIGAGKKIGIDNDAIIYDLNGRILTEKPKSGYYIQGGKKYFVEK